LSIPTFPSFSGSFVGRADELAQISTSFADPACRLLTLVGPGGIGKTRLALEAARLHLLLPLQSAYFIPLQPLASPDQIVSALASTLGFQFASGVEPEQQLIDYLREKAWLLVLDNFEYLLDGAPLLSEILADAPDIRLLVTSRERLNLVEEWVLEVGGLAYPARESDTEPYSAVELFVQQARRAQVGFRLTDMNRSAIGRICRLVGGMPLGIELAANWVRALSCDAIASELKHSLDILETAARNVEPRHRTMRAAFGPTWDRLTDDERDVFMRLSVFRGGFTREASEQVAGASLRALSALVDKSLLRVDANGRYDLHELLRQYAEEQLNLSGELAAARDAHSAHFAAFLQQKWQPLRSQRQLETLDEIELEFENIRTAWQWMVDQRKTAELSSAVYTVWYFSDLRWRFSDALPMFKQAEDALRPLSDDADAERVVGQMLTRRGWFYTWLAKWDEGRALVEEGLVILRRVGRPQDVALALDSLCLIEAWARNAAALKRNAEQEAEIARSIQDNWQLLRAVFPRTNAALYANDLEDAQRAAREFHAAAKACGDPWMRAMCCYVQMDIAEALGDYAEAKRQCEQGLELLVNIRQGFFVGVQYRDLGRLAFRMKDYLHAAQHFQQGLRLLLDTGGLRYHLLESLPVIAHLWVALGLREQALELVTLVLQHPESQQSARDEALPILNRLQAELPPQAFSAAQERGKKLELNAVVKQLIVQLDELTHVPALAIAPPDLPSIEVLTKRELEILRLVADGLPNKEIAEQLGLSVSTVKWHLNEIYSKLYVRNRTQAVVRARELKLLVRSETSTP
jgi:predicted ATPase/DNA-binding CsgD family transcriptional regulator